MEAIATTTDRLAESVQVGGQYTAMEICGFPGNECSVKKEKVLKEEHK